MSADMKFTWSLSDPEA